MHTVCCANPCKYGITLRGLLLETVESAAYREILELIEGRIFERTVYKGLD